MFFGIRKVSGNHYLYRYTSYRSAKTGVPTNSSEYIGPVEKVEKILKMWREKNESN